MDKIIQALEQKIKQLEQHKSDYWRGVRDGYISSLDFIEQLNKPVVSGKRPTVEDFFRQSYPESSKWDKFDFEMVRFDAGSLMDFAERYASQAACASGAVDKTVSGDLTKMQDLDKDVKEELDNGGIWDMI